MEKPKTIMFYSCSKVVVCVLCCICSAILSRIRTKSGEFPKFVRCCEVLWRHIVPWWMELGVIPTSKLPKERTKYEPYQLTGLNLILWLVLFYEMFNKTSQKATYLNLFIYSNLSISWSKVTELSFPCYLNISTMSSNKRCNQN